MSAAKGDDANLFSNQVRGLADIFLRDETKGKLVGGGGDEHEVRSLADGRDQRGPVRLGKVSASADQGLGSRGRSRDHDKIGIQAVLRKESQVLSSPNRRLAYAKAIIADQVAILRDESCRPCAKD